jgi:hypothetical protein
MGAVIAIAIADVWWFISKYVLLQVLHLPTKHCYHYYMRCLVRLPPSLLAAITIVVKKKQNLTVLHILILFCFVDDDSEFDGKSNGNNNGNGYGNDLSTSVL